MAIIDTLYLLFKADTRDLKKGSQEAERITKNTQDNLKNVGRESEKLGASFLGFVRSASNFLTAIGAGYYILDNLKQSLNYGADLSRTSRLLNVNVTELQAWGNAVELAGGDAKAFEGSIKSLSEKMGLPAEVILKSIPAYQRLFSSVSPGRAQQLGKYFGFDEGTVLLLQKTFKEYNELIKRGRELANITEEDAEAFKKYSQSLSDAGLASRKFFTDLALDAIPTLTYVNDLLSKTFTYADQHREGFSGFASFFGLGVATKFGAKILSRFFTSSALLEGLGALTIPEILIPAAISGFLYEDVSKYRQGTSGTTLTGGLDNLRKLGFSNWFQLKALEFFSNIPFLNKDAGASQIPSIGSNAGVNFNFNNTTITTQATDAEGFKKDLLSHANSQYAQTINFYADPVVA